MLIAIAITGTVLTLTGTPYATYFDGAQFVHFLLGPATVVLAMPLYEHRATVMRALLPMLAALVADVDAGVPVPLLAAAFHEALGTATGLGGPEDAARAIIEGRPAVVESREEPAFRQALANRGLVPRPAGAVRGLDYTNGDDMTLTLYRGVPQPAVTPEPLP